MCLRRSDVACEAFVTAGDARGAIIIIAEMRDYGRGVAFQPDAGDAWQVLGTLSPQMRCKSVREALRAGKYRWLPPLRMDLEVAGARLTVTPPLPTRAASCP